MWVSYFIIALFSFFITVIFVLIVQRAAKKWQIVDYPQAAPERKIHQQPVPLLGGLAIFLGFFVVVFILAYSTPWLLGKNILEKYIWGIFIGGLFLMLGGYLDDRYHLKPRQQIIWPILAVLAVMISGVGISKITNPFGGVFHLDTYQYILFWYQGLPYKITLPADIFTFIWMLGMMYTTKFLDGIDGLVSGITGIGALMIFFLCTVTIFYQPDVALLAIILAGACLGFLVFNFHPARIFLGEGGSVFTGFILGILAIIAGGKIATTLLVMGIPVLDAGWVILRRAFWEKKMPTLADKKHLHFRLLEAGFSQRQAVLFLYFLATIFGVTTLFLQSQQKLIVLGILAGVAALLGLALVAAGRKKDTLDIK